MITLSSLRAAIIEQIPPDVRFQESDAAAIRRNQGFLNSLAHDIVKFHYDTLFSHEPTRRIFREGERERLELLLANWWRRVVNGPIDDKFWDWMTLVGLVHIQRKVSNTMMLTAWGNVADLVVGAIQRAVQEGAMETSEAMALSSAFFKLGKTFTSLVAESYIHGLAEATGTNLALMENLAAYEVEPLVEGLRDQLRSS